MVFDYSQTFYGLASLKHANLGSSSVKNVVSLVNHHMPWILLLSPEDKRNYAFSFSTNMANKE